MQNSPIWTIMLTKEPESWTTIATTTSSRLASTSPSVSKTAAPRMCPETPTAEAQCRAKTGMSSRRRAALPSVEGWSRVSLSRVPAIHPCSTPPGICHQSRGTLPHGTSHPTVWPWATFPSTTLLSRMTPDATKTCLSPAHCRTSSSTPTARTRETTTGNSRGPIHPPFNRSSRNCESKINP